MLVALSILAALTFSKSHLGLYSTHPFIWQFFLQFSVILTQITFWTIFWTLSASKLCQISSDLLKKAFATWQHAFLSTSTVFYNISAQTCTEIKILSTLHLRLFYLFCFHLSYFSFSYFLQQWLTFYWVYF